MPPIIRNKKGKKEKGKKNKKKEEKKNKKEEKKGKKKGLIKAIKYLYFY